MGATGTGKSTAINYLNLATTLNYNNSSTIISDITNQIRYDQYTVSPSLNANTISVTVNWADSLGGSHDIFMKRAY